MVTGFRHLATAVRKSDMCKCGCKGWCTLAGIYFFLRFQFEHLATGTYPSSRHDGSKWLDSDCWRELLAGSPLGFIGVCLFIKGDWMELSVSLGMPTWQDKIAPCLCCKCPKHEELYNFKNLLPDDCGWPEATHEDYEEACTDCETHLELRNEDDIQE